ncbi:MAG: ATPase domain-containing protein [Zestosphaera sp.]
MDYSLTTGSGELDALIGGLLPRSMVLVVGHPGAGKTTLASQICYANTLRGKKCLYVTFYEDKDKLFRNMNRLGINLSEAESEGLFSYVKLPTISVDEMLKVMTELLTRGSYDVVVIDSINPTLELSEPKEARRAVLLNFFYQLANIINGLLIVSAEIPLGRESLNLGSVEFVADAIIYLKHRVTYGSLSRVLEIRKIRGAPLSIVEFPFSIVEGKGLKIYIPPRLERVIAGKGETFKTTLSAIPELVGPINRGDLVFISNPPHGRTPLVIIPVVDLAVTNDARVLHISYRYSPDEVRDTYARVFESYFGVERDYTLKALDKHFYIDSMNPASYSLSHMRALTRELIERLDPDIVVYHGVDALKGVIREQEEYWAMLMNELVWLKNMGKLVIRYASRVDPYWTRMNEALSDIVVRAYYRREGVHLKPVFYIWRRGMNPTIFDYTERDSEKATLELKELAKMIRGDASAGVKG